MPHQRFDDENTARYAGTRPLKMMMMVMAAS